MNWLRKSGTNEVFVRTKILAERADMIPITEEEAQAIRARTDAKRKLEIANISMAVVEDNKAGAPDPLDLLDEAALQAKAADLKIAFKSNWKPETLRKKIKEVMEADAKEDARTNPGNMKPAAVITESPETTPPIAPPPAPDPVE